MFVKEMLLRGVDILYFNSFVEEVWVLFVGGFKVCVKYW